MALDPEAVGTSTERFGASWSRTDALLYSVGIGAGTDELAYVTENTSGVAQQVFPTLAVVVGTGARFPQPDLGSYDRTMLVHGRQAITLHRPLPVEGSVTIRSTVAAMYDKGTAAVVEVDSDAADAVDGAPLFTRRSTLFIRGAGGWGGERGPRRAAASTPRRSPDHVVTLATSPSQALVYRLSGDRNPLHSDPSFAAAGGFDRPILHGLCTYGFTGRALLHRLCGGESARFRFMDGRFASTVVPGDTLTVRIWATGATEAVFTTSVGERHVLDEGVFRYA